MRKVLVIGSGGAGKSTFARRLGAALGVEVLHLDALYWNPGWVETPKAEWLAKVGELLRRDSWVMDGNYSGTLDVRFEACDTVVFLDMNRVVCLWRVLKRRILYRAASRPDMAPGCPEQLTLEFARWVWKYPDRTRPRVVEMLEANEGGKRIVWLRSGADVEKFFAGLDGGASST